ncbi:MAG TPA: NADH-quinone oxidoreductase subunit C [Solirubrobacteraceae bacterium]|nr:NADH-quinone oxidoreductase subunit C [Solirubrobacteraceae bacterium]
MTAPVVERVGARGWRSRVAAAVDAGARFAAAWATPEGGGLAWRVLLTEPGGAGRVLTCEAPGGAVDTIVDVVEAAGWDEREAHDLYGLAPDGHDPLRPLVAHPDDPAAWTVPVSGEGTHQVVVGPIHAGVIESGHFRFHVVGERILATDLRLFHKHRGLERAAEGLEPEAALAVAQRACAACTVANGIAYAQAIEQAHGLRPDRDLRRSRTALAELERLYNHLSDIGAVCSGVGLAPGAMAFAAFKDRTQRLIAELAGHRFLFGTVAVGHGRFAVSRERAERARATLAELRADVAGAWRDLEFAVPLQARLHGIGVLARDDALRLGAVGPAARASGVRHDVRTESPRLWYDGFAPARPAEERGDVAARVKVRAAELEDCFGALDDLLSGPLPAGAAAPRGPAGPPAAIGFGRVESPRGATTCAVELGAGRVRRLRLRTASYANWPALVWATRNELLPELPLINKSFELCYACVDR